MKRLRKLRHMAGKVCLAVLCCAVSFSVYAEQFMPVSEVRPGMTGYAKTVARGTEIETFPVEILGVMKTAALPRFDPGPVFRLRSLNTGSGIAQG